MTATETGHSVNITGKSGRTYTGKIYAEKDSSSSLTGEAIVCLTNSHYSDGTWEHRMNSIYNTRDVEQALDHFRHRDDISHIILIPHSSLAFDNVDYVDDLVRNYLHG
jgi:hypothetical protein